MIQKLKDHLVIILSVLTLAVPAVIPAIVAADDGASTKTINSNLCAGSNFDLSGSSSTTTSCDDSGKGSGLSDLMTKIVNIISAIVGVVAVIMIIVGGFRYITSGGDSNHVSSAKNTIIYAVIGLVIVALAQLIVHFVIHSTANL